LENAQRGAYCGSAGYIGFDGNVDMNILIRTIQTDNQSIIFHSGCGITAQSDATQEWQETKTKADKILQSFLIHKIY
jgi:para-aminobenzoate synthetase component 1